jgi:hypothetical protein
MEFAVERQLSKNQYTWYSKPFSNAGLSNAGPITRAKINSNNYLLNAKNSIICLRCLQTSRCSLRKIPLLLESTEGFAFAHIFVQRTWFVIFSARKDVNCHPAISSSCCFHAHFVSQTTCNICPNPDNALSFPYFAAYDIAVAEHNGTKNYISK